jgi:ABC-type cobalamin/Fe3+-siderophores transport system ATPase subunit
MLEKLLSLYAMSMAYKVRSPMPHLVGPAGCGKSTYVEQLAELLGVELHIINVSRLSPLEVEGVQMPHGQDADMHLRMLPATFWTQLKDGDVLLFDEFLRGFPEVYNGLLDIFTSRRVGAFRLPEVFIIGASNSVTSYDLALEDRLLHIPVPDPRKSKVEKEHLAKLICDVLGLLPQMAESYEMTTMLDTEVLPTYAILDSFKKKGVKVGTATIGSSVRNLLGQAQLRMVKSTSLKELIDANNQRAMAEQKAQYVLLLNGKRVPVGYIAAAKKIRGNPRLTPTQSLNISMNMQLIEMAQASTEEDEA